MTLSLTLIPTLTLTLTLTLTTDPNPEPNPNQVRAHIRRGKMLVLPILSSTAPLDLSSETRLM